METQELAEIVAFFWGMFLFSYIVKIILHIWLDV